MTDNTSQDKSNIIKDVLLQRDQDRKDKIKSLKEERGLASPDQVKLFHESFDEHSNKILECFQVIEKGKVEQKDLPDHLNKISKDLQILNRYLSVSTVFLTNYSVRKSLQTIEELESKVKNLEAEFLPKKKFGFKARKTKNAEKVIKKVDEVDFTADKVISVSTISCGFSDRKNESLKLIKEEVLKNDVELRNLEKCSVSLFGSPATVHISNIKNCKIICGPVSTSVFVDDCQDCDLVIACQQLRIHSTKDSRFYIHVTSKAIIEDSSNVGFAPYNLTYEGIEADFDDSGLDRSSNNWNKVDDFNWLASDVASPNWTELSEDNRTQFWPL